MTSVAEGDVQVWRPSAGVRWAAVVAGLGWLALAVGETAVGAGIGGAIFLWITLVVIGVVLWRWTFVPYIAVGGDKLVVQNRLRHVELSFDHIESVDLGPYYGIVIRRHRNPNLIAFAVSQSNWAKWRHKRTRADEVVEAIRTRLDSAPAKASS